MDRSVLLLAMTAIVAAPLAWMGALVAAGRDRCGDRERARWRDVVMPGFVATVGFAVLVGWALQEPETSDETLSAVGWALVAAFGVVWLRAIARAIAAVRAEARAAFAVVGVLRPRIVVDPQIAAALDDDALEAALAHEHAHLQHRDPLRIVVAGFAADLQWPLPTARRRLAAWRDALEEARDDEARATGVRGEDLAAAIVEVSRARVRAGGAALVGATALERRLARLLVAPAIRAPIARPRAAWLGPVVVIAAAIAIGFAFGEDLVALVPGVVR